MPKNPKTKRQLNEERKARLAEEAKARAVEKKMLHLALEPKRKLPDVYVPKATWRPEQIHYASLNRGIDPIRVAVEKKTYHGDLAQREKEAQKEIAVKKTRVAPLFNKGGYQYITDGTDLKEIGRKNPN